jgi:uncharacterized membrane protein YraQ (UPF0718 family)
MSGNEAGSRKAKGGYVHLVLPVALAVVATISNFAVLGAGGLEEGGRRGFGDLLLIGPRICAAILLAAVIQVWLPREGIRKWFGEKRGLKSLVFASVLGILTVGGPFASFPLVAGLAAAGVESGSLVSFLTGWSLLGIQRLVVWEWPLMGTHFVNIRFLACIAMPVVAGLLMRLLVRSPRAR